MNKDYRAYQTLAEDVAIRAGKLLLDARGRVSIREKGPADLVTEADFASQALIVEQILNSFPDHTVLGEEEGLTLNREAPFRWIIDPLDGTMNFAHGFPFWCVSIAMQHEGELVVGVVHNPLSNETYSASLGQGATRNGSKLSVSIVPRLENSLITTGLPTDLASDVDRQMAYMRRFSTKTHSIRRTGSSALNLAILAAGGCDVCYGTSMHPWDAAAGVVLVREAGGKVTRLDGSPYDVERLEILASNGSVHDQAIQAFEESWPGASK